MDRQTFDALMLRVAQQTSRRGALAVVLGATLLGQDLLSGEATDRAKRRKQRKRRQRKGGNNGNGNGKGNGNGNGKGKGKGQNQACGIWVGGCGSTATCVCACPPGQECKDGIKCPGNGVELCVPTGGCTQKDDRTDFCFSNHNPAICPQDPQGHCFAVGSEHTKQKVCGKPLPVAADPFDCVDYGYDIGSCTECEQLGYSLCVQVPEGHRDGCCWSQLQPPRMCLLPIVTPEV